MCLKRQQQRQSVSTKQGQLVEDNHSLQNIQKVFQFQYEATCLRAAGGSLPSSQSITDPIPLDRGRGMVRPINKLRNFYSLCQSLSSLIKINAKLLKFNPSQTL